jgi:dTDP-4-dehydrorhamnose reductase
MILPQTYTTHPHSLCGLDPLWFPRPLLGLICSSVCNVPAPHRELDEVKPTHVLNAAGVTGRPNVDWCEDNKETTIRANVIGALNLADLTFLRKIHMTVFATGCIFSYDAAHPIGGPGFTEEDKPNFFGSFYSYTKGMVEQVRRQKKRGKKRERVRTFVFSLFCCYCCCCCCCC